MQPTLAGLNLKISRFANEAGFIEYKKLCKIPALVYFEDARVVNNFLKSHNISSLKVAIARHNVFGWQFRGLAVLKSDLLKVRDQFENYLKGKVK